MPQVIPRVLRWQRGRQKSREALWERFGHPRWKLEASRNSAKQEKRFSSELAEAPRGFDSSSFWTSGLQSGKIVAWAVLRPKSVITVINTAARAYESTADTQGCPGPRAGGFLDRQLGVPGCPRTLRDSLSWFQIWEVLLSFQRMCPP